MPDVQEVAEQIIRREGGFADDPDDPGGATNLGVTIHTLRRLRLDLNRDGRIDTQDVKAVDFMRARDIFVAEYFQRPGIGRLPDCLHANLFDMYVNAGSNAVRILQQVLALFGLRVEVDGLIGPMTEGAARRAVALAPRHLADIYGIARRDYYYALADRRLASRKYARRRDGGKGGWISRAEEFIAPRFHLTEAEHAERTARWG